MSAAYEELAELLDQRGIGYSTSDHQAVRLDLRGEVAVYLPALLSVIYANELPQEAIARVEAR